MSNSAQRSTPLPNGVSLLWQRWRRPLWWFAGLLAVLWVIGGLVMPPVLRDLTEKQLAQQLGRQVTLESVSIRPWSLEVTFHGLTVAKANSSEPQFTVRRIYLDAELQSLLRLAPVVDAIAIDEPRLWVQHEIDGGHDIDDILEKLTRPSDNPDQALPRFALFNISVSDGAVVYQDAKVSTTHHIDDLQLQIPFLSNLDSRRDVVTQPHLSFTLNGDRFDSSASATPFADTRHGEAVLNLPDLDLVPYLSYWPRQWPIRPRSGELQLALTVSFEQQDVPKVGVKGQIALRNVSIDERVDSNLTPLFAADQLAIDIEQAEPLAGTVRLRSVTLDRPRLWLGRDVRQKLNLQRIAGAWPKAGPEKQQPNSATPTNPLKLSLAKLALRGGEVQWDDAATSPAMHTALQDIAVDLENLNWPLRETTSFKGHATLLGQALEWSGQSTADQALDATVAFAGLPLQAAHPYVKTVIKPMLEGTLSGDVEVAWRAASDEQAGLRLRVPQLQVDDLALKEGKQTLASLKQLQLLRGEWQAAGNRFSAAELRVESPQVDVSRRADGEWMFEAWLPPQAAVSAARDVPPANWDIDIERLGLTQGRVALKDERPSQPVRLTLDNLNLDLRNFRPLTSRASTSASVLSVAIAAGDRRRVREHGQLRLQGQLRMPEQGLLAPYGLQWTGQVTADRVPLHALEPYIAQYLNLELLRADAGVRGNLDVALEAPGPAVAFNGDVAIEDFHANTLQPSEDLLDWKALNVKGIDFRWAPLRPMTLHVAETVLSDYFARILIDGNGRVNLQDMVRPAQAASTQVQAAAADLDAPAVATTAYIQFGPVRVVNGRVAFADHFIQPNYSANLSEVTGSLGAVSNLSDGAAPILGDLILRGRAEGTAVVDISGKVNPLRQPPVMDIKGVVRGLELPPLSPYTVKYAGYGIERGQLSMEVSYRIDPDGALQASNQVILNQLRFGERQPGSEAPNLPVKLAVALLADRNGVIDVNLPISGSINDPQFRLGPIIVRMIFNLIGKALTSPFSLLAGAFLDGGNETSAIAFSSGLTRLEPDAVKRLDAVAKALNDRPGLQLTLVGHSDLESERDGYRRARLAEWVQAEKRRRLARAGNPVDGQITVGADEYPSLLKEVYRRADIAKPRNMLGLAKDVPQAEMEALLLASIPVSSDAMRELALARAVSVKDYLIEQRVASDRLFLTSEPCEADNSASPPASGSAEGARCRPAVDLRLEAR